MCEFDDNVRYETVTKWTRGYKRSDSRTKTGITHHSREVRRTDTPIYCGSDPVGYCNYIHNPGWYIYTNLDDAQKNSWSYEVIQEVWFKGSCRFGENGVNYRGEQGVRAEYIMFKKNRKLWSKVKCRSITTNVNKIPKGQRWPK